MLTKPAPTRPELNALLQRARHRLPTPAERREQAISFVYGNLMDCAPHVTREQVEEAYDALYGRGEHAEG